MNQVVQASTNSEIMESVLIKGDLAKLTPDDRNTYYMRVCESLGLNPLTRPMEYITLNGKMVMYAKRDAADQLRKINGVNIQILEQRAEGDLYIVTVEATDKTGRRDQDMGVVTLPKGGGDFRANAILKCITKAKRRVTLSICGLGFLDETEVEDIPAPAKKWPVPTPQIANPSPTSPPRSQAAGQPASSAEKPFDSEDDAGNLSREGWSDIEVQIDDALAEAATHGMPTLKKEWAATHVNYRGKLKARLDGLHKPAAEKVGA